SKRRSTGFKPGFASAKLLRESKRRSTGFKPGFASAKLLNTRKNLRQICFGELIIVSLMHRSGI
ncbi:MAG: hypothetical protein LUC97_05360, partial [Clostridiales bacterium]|nr:hypothetical protein [Clostridiales bacterium]